VARVTPAARRRDPALFVGSGKADEIKALVLAHGPMACSSTRPCRPAQQRNLERHLGVPVADRTALILEIFAARAAATKASCRSNWRGCSTWPRAWCGAGATWSASVAASAPRRPGRSADRTRPPHDRRAHQVAEGAARKGQAPARHPAQGARAAAAPSASRWWVTPTPASRRCSMRW
jgi:hypothetical protein